MRTLGLSATPPVRRRAAVLGAGLALALALLLAAAGQSHAALPDDPFAGLQPMNAAELSAHRGGFVTPSGLTINLGAHVRSTFDGQVVLESLVSFTPSGIQTRHSVPDLGNLAAGQSQGFSIRLSRSSGHRVVTVETNGTGGTGTGNSDSGGAGSQGGGVTLSSSGSSSAGQSGSITSAGATTGGSLTVPNGLQGVVQEVDGGFLAALHEIDPEIGRVLNLAAATAPNHTVEQTLTFTLEIGGWQGFQSALTANRLGSQIGRDMRAATIDALGN